MSKEINNQPTPETERRITIQFGYIFTRHGKNNEEVKEVITNVGINGSSFFSSKLAIIDGLECLEPEGTTDATQIIKIVGQLGVNEVIERYKNFFDKQGYPYDNKISDLILKASQMPPRDIRVEG